MGPQSRQARQRFARLVRMPSICVSRVGLLLLLLLAPYSSGLFLLAQSDQPDCGMQCCKRSKVCCCRKANRQSGARGPGWAASSSCPSGCGQVTAIFSNAAASLQADRVEVEPAVFESRLGLERECTAHTAGHHFAQFERPPPLS